MTVRLRRHAALLSMGDTTPIVERTAPGEPPSAFRIWKAGVNACDDGDVIFTEASAAKLMAEQEKRNRLYSFDYDHLSLTSDRPATAGQAAGWHSLDIRKDAEGGSELWAINIQWCEAAHAGLTAEPPLWRYFSPAFYTDGEGEVTSYINCALCTSPLTHNLPSLATLRAAAQSGVINMDKRAALAILASADSSEDEKKEALAFLAAAFDDEDKKVVADDDSPPAEEPEEEAEGDDDDEDKKEEAAKAASIKLAKENQKLKARMDAIEVRDIIASRDDLAPGVAEWLKSQSLATVKSFVAKTPKAVERRASVTHDQVEDATEHPIDRAFFGPKAAKHVGLGKPVNGIRALSFRKAV